MIREQRRSSSWSPKYSFPPSRYPTSAGGLGFRGLSKLLPQGTMMAHNPLHGSGQAALAHPQAQGSEATRSALLDSESGIERGVQNGMRNAWLISLGNASKRGVFMGIWHRRRMIFVFSTGLLWPICSIAQEQTTSQESSAGTTNKKESKKRQKQLAKEWGPAYGSWLRDEVPDIITEDERRAFLGLSTNEER